MDKNYYKDLNLPLIAAPLFLISGPKLVFECCKNGVVGTFPALNQRTSEGFEEWVIQIKDELADYEKKTGIKPAPFGVNLIVHPSNIRVKADLDICVKHKVPLIITSLGAVPDIVNAIHSYGGLVYHDIIKKRHAEKAAEANVAGLVLVTAGAGGHAGLKSDEYKKICDLLKRTPNITELGIFLRKQLFSRDPCQVEEILLQLFKWELILHIWEQDL